MSVYTTNTLKRKTLLHHPQRGAYTELQVLAVLENIGIPRNECGSALELEALQPAELRVLIAALVDSEEDPGPHFALQYSRIWFLRLCGRHLTGPGMSELCITLWRQIASYLIFRSAS